MNKTEKLICVLLGAVLAWYVWNEMGKSKERDRAAAEAAAIAATNPAPVVAASPAVEPAKAVTPEEVKLPDPQVPEKTIALENEDVILKFSSWGAVVKEVTLKGYGRNAGAITAENPPVTLSFSESPLGELRGVEALAPNAAYEVRNVESNAIVFVNAQLTRKYTLLDGYQIRLEETFTGAAPATPQRLSLGAMRMGDSKNDLLSVDSWALDAGKGKEGVIHHGDSDSPLKPYLAGGLSGGCSGSSSAAGMPRSQTVTIAGTQRWIALKNRFFVSALASSSAAITSFDSTVVRNLDVANYRPDQVSAKATLSPSDKRTSVFFVGPKQQSRLWDLGMRDVMEFGMWRYLCYPLVWVLNLFHSWIPNFGIAIILLTILVRILFWPLTHKSTVGMKKLQELQPKMKAIQAQFKDNPQRLQQETWALYKAEKVNPMSSCLPMLVQIPVFIALFNVLRSAVELRYAPFLWIADLSEPEGLWAAYLPFGGLNLLPILMAVTTGLQSAFTPSTGDKSQQKMMMIFMPLMMLFMFYSFPSALSLYWFLSNLFSIVQMWLIRRQTAKETKVLMPEVIDPPATRQMRRHTQG